MSRLARYGVASFLSFLLVLVPIVVSAQQPNVSLSASHGFLPVNAPRDWLLDASPLLVAPSQPGSSIITINPYNFPPVPAYTGRIVLSASCCEFPGAPTAGLVNPGIDVRIGPRPQNIQLPGRALPEIPDGLRLFLQSRNPLSLSIDNDVDVPGRPVLVNLDLTAQPVVWVPGNWVVRVRAENPIQGINESIPLLVNVLPPWPPDGPAPACTPGLEVLPLSRIDPNPYSWKASHPTETSYTIAAAFSPSGIASGFGMEITIRREAPPTQLAPNQAIVRFKNTKGWRTGIRSSNSLDCATSGPTLTADEDGVSATLRISTADTTTLVFSKSTCRSWFFGCLSTGLDDFVAFSEGPFWTLFGGRAVDIKTVGDWGNIGVVEGGY